MKNIETNLFNQLAEYGQSDYYPFHMPGHKRNPKFLDFGETVRMDITEIDHFDNLHHAEGIIREAQERMARLYGADESLFLVNGSSSGLISAILGCTHRGGRILVARNCHKSVYNAIDMGGLNPIYMYPETLEPLGVYGSMKAAQIETLLQKYEGIEAVIMTSPTYEGVVSDIAAIAEIVHQYGIPLIVDEAHGAHFGFFKGFPQTAVRCGADIVIQSAHKTLPSLTQTAMMHMNGHLVDRKRVKKFCTCMQTTSPSYIFMASLDHCMTLIEREGQKYFDKYHEMLTDFLAKCQAFKQIGVLMAKDMDKSSFFDYDMSKIVIYTKPVKACGNWLYRLLLNKYHLQMEMVSRDYVLGMTSFCDSQEGFDRLYAALKEIDAMDLSDLSVYPQFKHRFEKLVCGEVPEMNINEAVEKDAESVDFNQSEGRISAEYAYIYPPGVPFLVPGERIYKEHLEMMQNYVTEGFQIEGIEDASLRTIRVLKHTF